MLPFFKKKINLKPSHKLSLQSHEYCSKHLVVVIGNDTIFVATDSFIYIFQKVKNQKIIRIYNLIDFNYKSK